MAALIAGPAMAQSATVQPTVATDRALTGGDAVDDPAVWIHPTDPSKSLIIGTDKQNGLFTYELSGKTVQRVTSNGMGNVDVRYRFPLGGQEVSLVAVNDRATNGIDVYRVDDNTRQLVSVGAGELKTGTVPYGFCMYRSGETGKYYAFVTMTNGEVQQWELAEVAGTGQVGTKLVRNFDVGNQIEGCVADDELGALYVGEEDVGIWKYGAEPNAGTTRTQVDKTGSGGHLTADVEGLSIYYAPDGLGYLIASSQGNNSYVLYRREGNNGYVARFVIGSGNGLDGTQDTDGIDVTNAALGPAFPNGVFIAQDGVSSGNQNFKLVPWESIARAYTPALIIDTRWDPRLGRVPMPPDNNDILDAGTGEISDGGTDAGQLTEERIDAGTDESTDGGIQYGGMQAPSHPTPEEHHVDATSGCAVIPAGSFLSTLVLAGLALRRRRVRRRAHPDRR